MKRPLREWTQATVVAGSLTIDYAAAGCGPPLLLLAADPARWLDDLGPDARVIAPAAAAGDDTSLLWIPDFLDGLGLEGVALAVDDRFAGLVDTLAVHVRERFSEVRVLALTPARPLVPLRPAPGP